MPTINGTPNMDVIYGTDSADDIHGLGGNDIIVAGDGDDIVDGGDGNDDIYGEFGNDVLIGGLGNDRIDGGSGSDTIDFSQSIGAVGVALLIGQSYSLFGNDNVGTDQLIGVENVRGSDFNDEFVGDFDANRLDGGAGNDYLDGFMGDDVLIGGSGNDELNGGGGNDEIHGGAGADDIDGGDDNDTIVFDAATDIVIGEQIQGGIGVDTLIAQRAPGAAAIFDVSGITIGGIENLRAQGGATLALSIGQFAGVSGLSGSFLLTTSGALALTVTALNNSLQVFLSDAGNQLDLSGLVISSFGFTSLVGAAGNDTIIGTIAEDEIYGLGGSDNLYGGGGDDTILGHDGDDVLSGGAGIDWLIAGTGNDTFRDTAAGLNGDKINDFGIGDRIIITDASLAGFTFGLSFSGTLAFTGGSVQLTQPPGGRLVASAAPGGGVQITVRDVHNDFNGDLRSDFVIRDPESGWLTNWLANPNGSLASNGANVALQFPSDWHVVGTGNFNGDYADDLLLRSDAGWLTNWLGTSNGSFFNNGANTSLFFTPDWKVAGDGDFNGDGRSDLLLRRDDGWLTNWLGTTSGSFTNNGANTSLFFSTDWKIVGTADFNGDGYTDLLIRRDDGWLTNWLGTSSGSFTNNGANTALFFSTDWKVIGTGDFNGDGRDDLLLRRDDGWMTDWLGDANGGFTNNGSNTSLFLTTDWKVASIGDFNGDGRDDILLRNDSGWMTDWLGTSTGSFANNGASFSTFIAPNWIVQDALL